MRRRWVKVLTITVVVLAALFVAADRTAVHFADGYVATKVRQGYGFGGTTDGYTDVSINGFPFLTQAFSRNLDDVTLTAGHITADNGHMVGGYLDIDKVELHLSDVAVSSTLDSAEAQTVTGTVTISWAHLSDAVSRVLAKGGRLTVSPVSTASAGAPSQAAKVRVQGPYGGARLNAVGTLNVAGDELEMTAPGLQGGPDWSIGMPNAIGFTAVTTTASGVEITVVGHQVPLAGAGLLAR